MRKVLTVAVVCLLVAGQACAGTWMKSRGRTAEEAFFKAQEQHGKKFVKRGSCTAKQSDGYIYCDVLIEG
jgi:hypothetical protein